MIIIDGLIASGKSSILKELESRGYKIELQRINKWKHLSLYYDDPIKYAPLLQEEIISSYEEIYQENKDIITFCESCAEASMNTFVLMSESKGELTKDQISNLQNKYTSFVPDLYVWLDTVVDVCMQRIKIRGREGEEKIKKEYLEDLKTRYEDFIQKCEFPVLRLKNNHPNDQKQIVDLIIKSV